MRINFKLLLLFIFLTFSLNLIGQQVKIQDKDIPAKIDVKSLLKENSITYCTVPLTYDVTNSGTINKLTNIGNAETLKVDNNGGTINQTFVFVKVDNQTYLSPQKSEARLRENFETNTGIKIKVEQDLFKQVDNLKGEINQWKILFEQYVLRLDKLSDNDPRKNEGYKILEKYRYNLKTATCLVEDYEEDAIVKKDITGKKNYLFDLDKIKNDPNYFYIGEEIEGIRIAKKFNKYGYLIASENTIYKTNFKYIKCNPFMKGYGVAEDHNKIFVLDKSGKEILELKKTDIDSLKILGNGNFIIIKNKKYYNLSYFINDKGIVISDYYNKITPYNGSNSVFITTSYKRKDRIEEEHINVKPLIDNSEPIKIGTKFIQRIQKKGDEKVVGIGDINGLYQHLEKVNSFVNSKGKDLTKALKCNDEIINITKSKKKCDELIINQVRLFNNGYKALYVINKYSSGGRIKIYEKTYLIIKDFVVNKMVHVSEGILERAYFPIKHLQVKVMPSQPASSTHNKRLIPRKKDYIFGHKEIYYNPIIGSDILVLKKEDFLSFKIETSYDIRKSKSFFNASKNTFIGEKSHILGGVVDDKNLLIFGNYMVVEGEDSLTYAIGYGVMDFYGLNIIAPLFKNIQIDKSKKGFILIGYNNSNFKVDFNGNCLQNCDKYRNLIRSYFNLMDNVKKD